MGGVGWGGCKSDFNVCSRPFDWSKSIFNVSSTLLPDDLTWDRVRGLALDNSLIFSQRIFISHASICPRKLKTGGFVKFIMVPFNIIDTNITNTK